MPDELEFFENHSWDGRTTMPRDSNYAPTKATHGPAARAAADPSSYTSKPGVGL